MSRQPGGHGGPVLEAEFRSEQADFVVEELAGFEASGEGEHLLLTIEKRGMNTAHAVRRIAQWAGIAEMGVGYAGMKDRHAVTRQRFSVHLPKRVAPDLASLQDDSLRVLEHAWHNRKLPRGALRGNRFELVLRKVRGQRAAIDQRLGAIASGGLPNYFGEQRFGRDGDNVESARRMFGGQRVRREQRSIYLSAARSEMFNAVLAARVAAGDWATGREGDVWMLDGSQSVFGPEPSNEGLIDRVLRLDIHATGPMWGRGELRSAGATRELEEASLEAFGDLREGLEAAGLKQERRALRVRVAALFWDWVTDEQLALRFELPPGAYATGLLAELGQVRDAHTAA